MKYQNAKKLVREYYDAMENATADSVADVLKQYTNGDDYHWRGVYPFREQFGADTVAEKFWSPLMRSLRHYQRRMDIFIGGTNEICLLYTSPSPRDS